MNGLTSQLAVAAVENRYDLVLIASRRARELSRGYRPKVTGKNSPIVTALMEIEAGHVGRDYLLKPTEMGEKPRQHRVR